MITNIFQDYIFDAADIPTDRRGGQTFIYYVIPTDQIVVAGNIAFGDLSDGSYQVSFRGQTYSSSTAVIIIDGPFDDPSGAMMAWHDDEWQEIQLAPFLIPDEVPRWGNLIHNYSGYFGAQDLFHGFVTGANRSFGFSAAVDHIDYCAGNKTNPSAPSMIPNPALTVTKSKDDSIFLPELFSQGTAGTYFSGELGIKAFIVDENGVESTYDTIRFYCHEVNPIQRENTQFYIPGHSPVNRVNVSHSGTTHVHSVPAPFGVSVERKTSSTYLMIDHFEIDMSGTVLTNYMYPSSVWMPDNTWRVLAYNRAEERYESFSTTISSEAGGYMTTVWGTEYHAAHMTRLIDGTLCSMAWTFNTDDKRFYLWFKRSFDDGATWDSPTSIASFSSTTIFQKTFDPTWVILQDYRTGTVVIGNYYSDDMGHTWNLTT